MVRTSSLEDSLHSHRTCLRLVVEQGVSKIASGILSRELFEKDLVSATQFFDDTYVSLNVELEWDLFYDYLDAFNFSIRGVRFLLSRPIFELSAELPDRLHLPGAGLKLQDWETIKGLETIREYGFFFLFTQERKIDHIVDKTTPGLRVVDRRDIYSIYLAGVFDSWFDTYLIDLSATRMSDYVYRRLSESTGCSLQEFADRQKLMRIFLRDHQGYRTALGTAEI